MPSVFLLEDDVEEGRRKLDTDCSFSLEDKPAVFDGEDRSLHTDSAARPFRPHSRRRVKEALILTTTGFHR